MKNTIITLTLYGVGIILFLFAAYAFLNTEEFNMKISLNFAPSVFLFILGFLSNSVIQFSSMDPLTIVFIITSIIFVLLGLVVDDPDSERLFSVTIFLMSFVGGFEAGKVKQKNSKNKPKHTNIARRK